ncbi:ABC transporter permease [Leptolyngbya sp. FACHB-711]|uniref:ABC transporter permease subunit n=1 Tax=unclassified Leptolyngbya TaxID=2650499 RepID=UPI00168447BC|nr:ABC transporter permease [Cyanobacteria bacterium FACHB-502]MBD2024403.1 ABC transporter permease [Leptolyngbya sp. FACHB-711]
MPSTLKPYLRQFGLPLLAILTAIVITVPVIGFALDWNWAKIATAYGGLLDGALFKRFAFANTLVAAIPLMFTGLALALGFRTGVFNIGAPGQFLIGATCAVFVGYAIPLPPLIHPIAALIAGIVGGGLWGAIPGFLKARFGSHEVINTIMLNYLAFFLQDWLVKNPLKDPNPAVIRTPEILATAELPRFYDRLHIGLFLALLTAFGVWYLLSKTTLGYELRTVGSNPEAAKYAGMKLGRLTVLSLALSGALAGLGGAVQILGVDRAMPVLYSSDYGFDAIPVALLGQNQPIGVVLSAILFGALRNGSDLMQLRSGGTVAREVIFIVQAVILLFVAAPAIVRWLYRLRLPQSEIEKEGGLTRGWG